MSNDLLSTTTSREHIEDLSSAYVLGALNDDEAGLQEFESLIESGDSALASTLEQMFEASVALALAVPQIAPPPALREALLEKVGQLKTSQNGAATVDRTSVRSASSDELQSAARLKKRTRYFIGTSIFSGLLLCVLLALNVSKSAKLERSNDLMRALLKQTDSLRENNAGISKTENDTVALIAEAAPKNNENFNHFLAMFSENDSRLVTLASVPLGSSREHLFFSPKQKKIALLREGLAPLAADKTYELWATTGDKAPVAVGTFKVSGSNNPSIYSFATKLKNADSFAISIESGNGGSVRKGDVIFTGTVPKTGIN